ncbi:MAG TPA: zinc-binding dehydrogenase [Dehalococcoidia bacterium]|nr:zinc-binding dehydrogenase [Dehalococcoidia bacterium]
MKAAVIHEYGDEDVFRYEDAPDPSPGPDEVLIKIRAAALNRGDFGRRSGGFNPTNAQPPIIIGWDVAGDVVEAGANVTNLKPGDRVVSQVMGGGYAELVAAPAIATVVIPEAVSYEAAASLPVAWLTAWIALLDTAALQPGETVLVQSASSGVGMAGIQIAKKIGGASVVFTTAGTDEKCARALELGADYAINYSTGDFLAEVLEKTNGRGVDVALDMIGVEVFRRTQLALADGGRLVSVGRAGGLPPEPDMMMGEARGHQITTGWLLFTIKPREEISWELTKILNAISEGKLDPVVDKVFPLSEAAEAHRYLAGRNQFGKVLLRP